MLKPGDIIYDRKGEEYSIIEPIGRGGMGYVLLVEKVSDKKNFAVKTLAVFIEGDSDHKALLNEGRLAEKIKHKNVIRYKYFHDGEKYPNLPPYIIMEIANEGTLQDLINDRIRSNTTFAQEDLINLCLNLIDGMEAINSSLVHRDIKPANILFKNGNLKISDFGIAKIAGNPTRTKSFKGSGTISFFPPEAFLGKENSIQMDIYSMGIIFYLLATLKHPYEINGEITNEDDWKKAHLYTLAESPQKFNETLSPKISSIIQKMIEKSPSKRFSSWGDIRLEMESVDKLKNSVHSNIIEKMIVKNSEKAMKAKELEIESTRRKEAEDQKLQIIFYQFKNDIIRPIEDFIKEYNNINNNPDDKISIQEISSNSHLYEDKEYKINVNGSSWTSICIHPINNMDSLWREEKNVFNDYYRKEDKPQIDQRKVLAWGIVKDNIGKGFNIILLESNNNEYGDWCILKNTHSFLTDKRDGRPDPFPFDLQEIKEEIYLIKTMHIYNTQVLQFEPGIIIEFISDL